MSAQTSYGYFTPASGAGGILDLAPYAIDSFLNEEENGTLKAGMGVVQGSQPGRTVALPTEDATDASAFEGIVSNGRTTQYDLEGELSILKGKSVGVMRWGRIYGRVAEDVEVEYGDAVYLVVSGDEAGYFTNSEDDGLAVKGRFLSGVDLNSRIAAIELYNQEQE